ncbi:hypothetical protein GH5_07534 [Leishmania sp. Ghana 2012 LV757]|uniref:hypothetical protein n=1 Tax=Leishmania sp. Ghana 2012 LV757 TaxID=2803181 RepID=UPI001B53CEE9|nr:hypothetical protein GH5_07534 [Leishmania sp. Ghana 2012 LV757]
MARQLTRQRRQRIQIAAWSRCLNLLRRVLTGNTNVFWATASTPLPLSQALPLLRFASQPHANETRRATAVLLLCCEALRAALIAEATPAEWLRGSEGPENQQPSPVDAPAVDPSARASECRVTPLSERCATRESIHSGRGPYAPLLTVPAIGQRRVHTTDAHSEDSAAAAITVLRTRAHRCEIAVHKARLEWVRRRAAMATRHQRGGISCIETGMRGVSSVHAFSAHCTGLRIPILPHHTTRMTRGSSTPTAASRSFSSCVAAEGKRSASQGRESSSSAAPSSSSKPPRVTRRLAAAWQRTCNEAYLAAHSRRLSSSARSSSHCTWSFSAEEELRVHFQRALLWRSDASAHAVRDSALVAERELQPMAAFVVETCVSLCGKLKGFCCDDAALALVARHSSISSALRWQLFALLVLADEVCAALGDRNADSTRTSRRLSEDTNSSVVSECIVAVTAAQLCALRHVHCQMCEAGITGFTTGHSEANPLEVAAVAPPGAHAVRATRRLVESLLALCTKDDEGFALSSERRNASGMCSLDSWLGQQLCGLAETSCCSLHAVAGHKDQGEAFSAPLLLLLRLLVQSTVWLDRFAAADADGAQHLRQVCAAVLLIERVVDRASEDEQPRCLEKLRGALQLSPPLVRKDGEVGGAARLRAPASSRRARHHSQSFGESARAEGVAAPLPAATGCFVCHVLDGCPPSISYLLLLSRTPSQPLHSTTRSPETLVNWVQAAEEMVMLLAPGMALSVAWRQRHSRAVESMLRASPMASATAIEYTDAVSVGAAGCAGSTAPLPCGADAAAHCALLQRRNKLMQVCRRFCLARSCPSPSTEAAASLLPWRQAFSSPFLSTILSQLDSPAVARIAEVMLETFVLLPPLLSAVPHEGHSTPPQDARAARRKKRDDEGRGSGEVVGATRCRFALLALQGIFASLSIDAVRAEVSHALLSRFCTALTESVRTREGGDVDLTRMRVHGAGLCLDVLLACASTSLRDQAAATHQLLTAFTSTVDGEEDPPHSRRKGDAMCAVLRSWWPGALGGIMLARHAQLARGESWCVRPASVEPHSGEAPYREPLGLLSPAAQFAAWWEDQPRLREAGYWAGTRMMRLCNTAAHLAAASRTTSTASSPKQLPSLPALSTTDAEAAKVACTAVYDALSLEQICHLALASAALPLLEERRAASTAGAEPSLTPACSSAPMANVSCVCALATTEAAAMWFDGDLSSEDGVTSIFRHALTSAPGCGDGVLNVLQHRQGRPLTDRQHESLVEALRDISRRRGVREAVALFYAHERQHRRLQLAEVELFAETAKRAPLSFLVRVLLYVPPPCESALLARAIITGAWKAYQRALNQHSRRVAAAAAVGEKSSGAQREKSALTSRIRRQSRRRVEQAWYESLAVARRALALLPSAGGTDELSEVEQRQVVSILQRLVYARPRSMQPPAPPRRVPSSSTSATGSADEWDSCAVESAQLLAALLRSSRSSIRARQSHHELEGAPMRHSVKGLCQIIQLCDANGDAATAVQAYLRFSNSHASSSPHSRLPSSAGQGASKQASATAHADYGQVVPLLSLDMCVSLLHLASVHVSTACDDGTAASPTPATAAAPSKPMPLAALIAFVEEHHESWEGPAPEAPSDSEAPHGGAALMQNTLGRKVGGNDGEVKMQTHSRAALEESAAAPSGVVTEHAAEMAGSTSKPARNEARGSNGRHASDTNKPASVATAARAATSRVTTYALNCIAAVQRLSPTLPASLRCVVHADSALIPLTAVLHDALRWCRLRPRSMPAREGATITADGLDAASLHMPAHRADSDDPAAVDVVAQLIAAMFQLDSAEMGEMIDVAPLHPGQSLVAAAEAVVTETDAAAAMAAVAGREASSLMVVTRRTFVCRAACANPDFWRLVRHTDVLLSYIWDYVWELYRLESTVLWVSPAQQQRAYLAVAECAQVIVAALQALDVWAVKMRAHEACEQDHSDNDGDGGGDHQVEELASRTAARSCVPSTFSSDWELRGSVDEWRGRLRSGTLQRVLARLLDESELPDAANGSRGETAPTTLPYYLPSWESANTTSAAIAHVTAVIQHSRRAFESCVSSHALMQLPVNAVAASSAAPSDPSLAAGVMTTCAISTPSVRELLSATTQQYYDAVSRLVSASLPAIDDAGALLPAHFSRLGMDSLSYVLNCVTVAAVSPRQPHTSATVADSETGGTVALLARMAATEAVLRHAASLVQHALVHIEVTETAPHTANAQLLRTLWGLSATLKHAAVLLDECTAWWTLLDLEAATAAAPPSDLLGASDAFGSDFGRAFTSASTALTAEGVLAHLRAHLKRLAATLVDLYASGWSGGVHAQLSEVTRARLWSREELRAQHLHVCLVLNHLASDSGDAAVSARLVGAAEALEQTLARHPSASAASTSRRRAQRQLQSGPISMDALIDDRDESVTEAAQCTAAAATRTLERMLLAYLTLRRRGAGAPDQMTLVSITAMESSFQRAAVSQLPPSLAALLWRLFPALIDDGCHAPGAFDEAPDGAGSGAPHRMPSESSIVEEILWSATCAVPTTLWRQLVRLGGEGEAARVGDALRSGGAHAEASAMHRELLAVYAALLSRKPLVLTGVVCHPLVRHHQLAEAQQTQCQRGRVGAGSFSAADRSEGLPCEWLKKLLLHGAEDDAIVEARLAPIGEAGEPILPTAGTTASSTLSQGCGGGSLCTSSRGSLAFLFSQPLREQFVSALILAVLRDASLIDAGLLRVPITAASNAAGGATAPTPSLPQPTSSMTSLAVETLMAQRRECMLLELVRHLGYVAPHAVRTAFRWITGTPYPPGARAPLSASFPAEAVPPAELKCSTLSCADATSLRRLRVALLSCGPWPTNVARTLLEYATRAQGAATEGTAAQVHTGDCRTAAAPFPEALELYHGLRRPPENERNTVAAASRALTDTEEHQLDAVGSGQTSILRRTLSAPRSSRKAADSLPTAQRWAGRFPVGPSLPLPLAAAAPSSSARSISDADGSTTVVPLSSIQLACEEGACLVNALRAVDAPRVEDAAVRIALRMRDLATAPSYTACARLLTDDVFATDVMALPTARVVATLLFAWRTLLLRAAELDCRGLDRVSANGGDGAVATEVCSPARKPQRGEGGSKDSRGMTVHDVYAMFFLAASRIDDRLPATAPPPIRPKVRQWLVNEQRQLSALRQEVAAYWVAVWADEVLASATVLSRSTASEAEAIRARVDKYCSGGADGGAMLCPTLGFVNLWEHLRRAQARMQTASHERSASCSPLRPSRSSRREDCRAAAELSRVHKEASAQLRDACARMTRLPRSITAEASLTPEGSDMGAASEQAWSLWPPAASETYQLRASMRESLKADALVTVTVRHPFSVVAYLRTWQRERESVLESGRACTRAARRLGRVGDIVFTECGVTRAACVLLPAASLQFSHATQSAGQPVASRTDVQRISQRTTVSLMDVWRAVDAFERRGRLVLACMPRGGHSQGSGCGVTRGSGGGVVQAGALEGDQENTTARASPAGAGVVMEAFCDVVSLEDARLQKERQGAARPSERARSGDMLVLLSVLRQLRQRLLPPPAGTAAAMAADRHGGDVASTARSAHDRSGLVLAASQWTTFAPLSHAYMPTPPPSRHSDESGDAVTDPSSSVPSRDDTAWHSYLHVLHLCGDGLLCRVAQRRGRRASPSAAILTHVALQLQRLVTLSRLEEQAAHSSVSSAFQSRLLSDQDAEHIICFQVRALQRIRDHVSMLGWTAEQHMELQLAQQSVVATVAAICTLQRRSHHDHESSLGERGRRAATTGGAELSTRTPKRVAARMHEGRVNQVEEATAACFYPALAHLLRQCSATHPRSRAAGADASAASPSALRFPAMDRTPRVHWDTTEVVTEFGGAAASARRRHGPASSPLPQKAATTATAESDRVAATLLATIHDALCEAREQASSLTDRRPTGEAVHTCSAPTPLSSCRELHAFLSAVVAAVQRRSRDADPRLLLDFLSGKEAEELRPLGASAEAPYLEMLMKSVTLAESACWTTQHGPHIAEAGLILYALLSPWLPLSASARQTCAVEAALCLVTLALQQQRPLSDTTGTGTAAKSPATSLSYLLQAVLVDILHRRQWMRLSVRSVVLLGVIYSQLRNSERGWGTVASTWRTRRSFRTAPQVEARVLLWRTLSALSALSEKDAAEVRDAWVAEREATIVARGTGTADHEPARVPGNAAPPYVSGTIRLRTEMGCARAHECSGVHVIEVLYHGSLQILGEGVSSDGPAEAKSGRWRSPLLLAATRLRAWLAREEVAVASHLPTTACTSDSAAAVALHPSAASRLLLPQLRLVEEVLCRTLGGLDGNASGARRSRRTGDSPFGEDKGGELTIRRNRLACLRMYNLYAELKRACSPPPWRGQQCFLQSQARNGDGDGSQHHGGGSRLHGSGACVGDVASLVLELAVVAALSATGSAPPCRHASAMSDERQLALLSAFVTCCDSLGTPLPSLPCPPRSQRSGPENSSTTPVAAQAALPEASVLARVSVDVHAAVRHLATRLLCRLAEDMPLSALAASTIFHDWRDVLTPLRALQRVPSAFPAPEAGVPEGDEGGVWVLSTSAAGLQWAPKRPEDVSFGESATCLEAPSSDVDHVGRDAAVLDGQQALHSQRRHRYDEQSLHSMYYATLRLLCGTKHLLALPPPVLLKELLHPLAELERAAAEASSLSPTAAEATPCAVKPTAHDRDDSTAGRSWKAADRLARLVDVAQRVSVHPALREPTAAADPRDGGGSPRTRWTTAWLVFKALEQVEEALFAQCEVPQSNTKVGGRAARATATSISPSRMFAARYADLLAQRGAYAPDYLAFVLIVSHHCHGLLPMPESAPADAPQADEERRVRLRYSQLCHVLALAVPPHAVGAAMQLFQLRPLLHPLGATAADKRPLEEAANASTAAWENNATKQRQWAHSETGASSEAGLPLQALTPHEAALLQRLHRLLQTARGT